MTSRYRVGRIALIGAAALVVLSAALWFFVLPRVLPNSATGIRAFPGTALEFELAVPGRTSIPSAPPDSAPGSPTIAPFPPLPSTTDTAAPEVETAAQDSALPPREPTRTRPAGELIIPVAGVEPEDLVNTFDAARGEGRTHDAIDIIAPRGTPVLAAADGRVLKLFRSEGGGITLYQLDTDGRTIYFYAHLDRYAPGIVEGQMLRQGEVLGYVGDTGNAREGNYHLHFGITITDDPEQWWGGRAVNPYPLLRGGSAPASEGGHDGGG